MTIRHRTGAILYCWKCNKPLREKGWSSGTHVGYYFCDRFFCRLLTRKYKKINLINISKASIPVGISGNKI